LKKPALAGGKHLYLKKKVTHRSSGNHSTAKTAQLLVAEERLPIMVSLNKERHPQDFTVE